MIPYAAVATLIEIVLIIGMGGAGAYAFNASSAFAAIREFGFTHRQAVLVYFPLLVWGFLAAFGVLNNVLRNKGAGVFTWVVMLFTLPSLLGQNAVDWPGILNLHFEITTSLGAGEMIAVGVFIIAGYMALDYIRAFKESAKNMTARQVTPAEIENITEFSYVTLLLTLAGALAAAALVAFLARTLELVSLGVIRNLPWNAVCIGLFCLLVIAFFVYWLGARRVKSKANPDDTELNRG